MDKHDTVYKLLFSHDRMVRDLLVGFLPGKWTTDLDLDSLEKMNGSYVTDDLRGRHGVQLGGGSVDIAGGHGRRGRPEAHLRGWKRPNQPINAIAGAGAMPPHEPGPFAPTHACLSPELPGSPP